MEAYQRAAGLRVTGMAGPTTQRLLYGGTSESGSYSKLDVGSTGSAVKRLQYALYELKYYDGDISGTYDTVTQNAVMVFQELNGLSIDGVAGQQTQQKLFLQQCGALQHLTLCGRTAAPRQLVRVRRSFCFMKKL